MSTDNGTGASPTHQRPPSSSTRGLGGGSRSNLKLNWPARSAKTALAFTQEQREWLQQQADRRELWMSDVFGEMLRIAFSHVRDARPQRRRRSRTGRRYVPTQVHLDSDVRAALDTLAKECNQSRAATARMVVDYVRGKENL